MRRWRCWRSPHVPLQETTALRQYSELPLPRSLVTRLEFEFISTPNHHVANNAGVLWVLHSAARASTKTKSWSPSLLTLKTQTIVNHAFDPCTEKKTFMDGP